MKDKNYNVQYTYICIRIAILIKLVDPGHKGLEFGVRKDS